MYSSCTAVQLMRGLKINGLLGILLLISVFSNAFVIHAVNLFFKVFLKISQTFVDAYRKVESKIWSKGKECDLRLRSPPVYS